MMTHAVTMKRWADFRMVWYAALACVITLSLSVQLKAQPAPDDATAFIQQVIDDAFAIIRDETLDATERKDQLRDLAYRDVAIDYIARLSLGRFARAHDGMSPEERARHDELYAEYQELFPEYISEKLYDLVMREFESSTVVVTGTEPVRKTDIFVKTEVRRPGREAVLADWRLRADSEGELKIIDVRAEGISLTITQRDDFAAIIGGGGLGNLVDHMREQVIASRADEAPVDGIVDDDTAGRADTPDNDNDAADTAPGAGADNRPESIDEAFE